MPESALDSSLNHHWKNDADHQHGGHSMRKVIALLTHAVESGDRAARDGWEYFGSFGDDIFSDDTDDASRAHRR